MTIIDGSFGWRNEAAIKLATAKTKRHGEIYVTEVAPGQWVGAICIDPRAEVYAEAARRGMLCLWPQNKDAVN